MRYREKGEKDMQRNKIIVPTGYMGSGSSVVTDLVSEFEGFEASRGTFEYVFLHCPNGVFDLEDKLLVGNNAIRSDEALHSFYTTMKELYDKKYWWVGHYNEIVGEEFLDITKKYIEELIHHKPEFYWYYQENTNIRMFFQLLLNRIVKMLTLNRVRTRKPLTHPQMWLSYVSPQEFYEKTKKYIATIMDELGSKEKNIILDQLLLPFNLHRIDNYFVDNIEVFVVDRDPRDMFLMNKYVYAKNNEPVPYSTNVHEFCDCYRRLRQMEKECHSQHVHRFKFEDFIYRYDEMVEKVQQILGDGEKVPEHILKKTCFIPEKSINNTQVFYSQSIYEEETKVIERLLPEYFYDFPYQRAGKSEEMF